MRRAKSPIVFGSVATVASQMKSMVALTNATSLHWLRRKVASTVILQFSAETNVCIRLRSKESCLLLRRADNFLTDATTFGRSFHRRPYQFSVASFPHTN